MDVAGAGVALGDLGEALDECAGGCTDNLVTDDGVEGGDAGGAVIVARAPAGFGGDEEFGFEAGGGRLDLAALGDIEAGEVGEVGGAEGFGETGEEIVAAGGVEADDAAETGEERVPIGVDAGGGA